MPEDKQQQNTLILVIRGWGDALERLSIPGGNLPRSFLDLLRRTFPDARIEAPDLAMGTLSKADPDDLVDELLATVDRHFTDNGFDRLIIIGFSAGSVLARSLFARAHGAKLPPQCPAAASPALPGLDPGAAKPWADRIERLVLLAGVTRGWMLSTATPALIRFLTPTLLFFLNTSARLQGKAGSFIQSFKRGAPFVVESRLLLLQVERHFAATGRKLPHTVLLLGSRDEYVSPADALDLGLRNDCTYIEVPASSHTDILDVDADTVLATNAKRRDASRCAIRAERAERIVRALTQAPERLAEIAMNPDDLDDYLDEMDRPVLSPDDESRDRPEVSRVVMIVHGIRDNGFWTKRVAREVKALARTRGARLVRAPTPSYGFFSMFDFMIPWGRQNATYWFLEKYAEIKVRYPDAPISFIGHSNGTYLAARALELSPFVAFERILFAGSVVRTSFDWSRFGARVGTVLNLVASRDGVVAFLPGAFERLGLWRIGVDVGGAGFSGFSQIAAKQDGAAGRSGPVVENFRYLVGSHGVGVGEGLWRELAAFAVSGSLPERAPRDENRRARRTNTEQLMDCVAPAAPIIIALILVGVFALLVAKLQGWLLAIVAVAVGILINNIIRYY